MPVGGIAAIAEHHSDDGLAPHRFGHELLRWCADEGQAAPHLVGRLEHEVPPEPHEGSAHLGRVHQQAPEDDRADRVEPEVEGGDDPEVAAAAPDRPEQVGVLVVRGHHLASVGRHDLGTEEVVAGEPELALQPAAPASQGQSSDPRLGHPAAGDGQPVRLGGRVELTPGQPGLGANRRVGHIDVDALHAAKVDAHPVVADGRSRDPVAAAVDAERQPFAPSQVDRGHHVVGGAAPSDDHRAAVDHGVEHRPGFVVPVVAGMEQAPPEALELVAVGLDRHSASQSRRPRAPSLGTQVRTIQARRHPTRPGRIRPPLPPPGAVTVRGRGRSGGAPPIAVSHSRHMVQPGRAIGRRGSARGAGPA